MDRSDLEALVSELNTQNAGQQKELRQLRQDKAALEARLDRVSTELEGSRDLKRALDGTRAELARTQKECEAKLQALDADAKSIVSRAQSAANDLKAQLQPITDRAIRAEQTIEQQRAEYTKVISNERAANDALHREREKLVQEIKKNAALMQAKTVAEERLSGHEQTIAGMQQRLQEQSVALKAAGVREKELNSALERDRESSAQTEKSLRRRISELEQHATEAQAQYDQSLLQLRVEHERSLSTSSLLVLQDELNQLRSSQSASIAEARDEATKSGQSKLLAAQVAWADEKRALESKLEQSLESARGAKETAVANARQELSSQIAELESEITKLTARLESIDNEHQKELAQVKSDLYDKLTAERAAREAMGQRADSLHARAAAVEKAASEKIAAEKAVAEAARVAAEKASADKAAAEKAVEEQSKAIEKNVISQAEFDALRAELESSRAELQQARQQVETVQQECLKSITEHQQNQTTDQIEEVKRESEREIMRMQTKVASERVELRKQAEAEKLELSDSLRLQFREESAMMLLSFEQQVQMLQSELQACKQQQQQIVAPRSLPISRPISNPVTPVRSRPLSISSSYSSGSAISAIASSPSANLLSSSAGDLRARSQKLAGDRRATLDSLQSFSAALALSPPGPGGVDHRQRILSDDDLSNQAILNDEPPVEQQQQQQPVMDSYRDAFVMVADTDMSAEPVMQYDDTCSACTLCSSEFGILNRRHHCRACGFIFCAYCSSKSSLILWRGDKQDLRICDVCVLHNRYLTKGKLWK